MYVSEPSPGTNGRAIPAPRGKVLGGSSSINGMGFNRGQAMDFDVWAQKGNRGWSYDDILPYFCRFETYKSGGDLAYRGQNGEMTITDLDWRDPLCEAYIEGANSLGIPRNPDYNGKAQEGISYLQRTVNGRTRMSAAKAFLNPAKKRPNLKVITNAHVTRLTLKGKQVTGVSYHKGGVRGKDMHLKAAKDVETLHSQVEAAATQSEDVQTQIKSQCLVIMSVKRLIKQKENFCLTFKIFLFFLKN